MKSSRILPGIVFIMLLAVSGTARAQDFGVALEGFGGGSGFGDIGSPAAGAAAFLFFKDSEDPEMPRFGLRPEFAWHGLSSGTDFFYTGSFQVDVPLLQEDWLATIFLGGGLDHYKSKLGASGSATPSRRDALAFRKGKTLNGPVLEFGFEAKFFPLEQVYVGPGFNYLRGFNDVEGNSFRVFGALGVQIN